MIDFTSPDYLLKGNTDQKRVWKALMDLKVFECLSVFSPVLAGTYPLNLAMSGSDLDILCEVRSHREFSNILVQEFGDRKDFRLKTKYIGRVKTTIARFEWFEFPIEIFGQRIPVIRQNAYKHLVVEWYLLQNSLQGQEGRIRSLKNSGLSTEEAFAFALELEGDPYQALINLGQAEGVLG